MPVLSTGMRPAVFLVLLGVARGFVAPAAPATARLRRSVVDEALEEATLIDLSPVPDVVCARGICVVEEPEEEAAVVLWPKALLLGSSVLYGTNFALGRLMNDALPASASTSARFVLAAAALSPWLLRLEPKLATPALVCGAFTTLGYVTQSAALVTEPASTVAFLGALTVVVCPALGYVVDGRRDLGPRDAPQVWLAGALCLLGVGLLELPGAFAAGGGAATGLLSVGDGLAMLQAVGFGTSFFLTEKMMAEEPTQALPITACQVSVVAAASALWAAWDGLAGAGWLLDGRSASFALPGLFLDPALRTVALAAAWTGLATTAANRVAETTALGRVSSAEASVLLATEPLWAALFAALLIAEPLSPLDAAGGALIVAACVAASADPDAVRALVRRAES